MTFITPKMSFSYIASVNLKYNFSIFLLMHPVLQVINTNLLCFFFFCFMFLLFVWLRALVFHPFGGQQYEHWKTCFYCTPIMDKHALYSKLPWKNIMIVQHNVSVYQWIKWAWIKGRTVWNYVWLSDSWSYSLWAVQSPGLLPVCLL